jgi:hypothetical protein
MGAKKHKKKITYLSASTLFAQLENKPHVTLSYKYSANQETTLLSTAL